MTAPGVLIVGTLDTKGMEIAFVANALERLGCRPVVIDAGIRGEPTWDGATYQRGSVAEAAHAQLRDLRELPRGEALARMAEGVKTIVGSLLESGGIEGALCIGGAGVSVATPAFALLGHGFPKLLVTPLASGRRTFEAFVGTADIAMMHSVADIIGVNEVTQPVFVQAAGYIAGAVRARRELPAELGNGRALIAATMNGNTTPALMHAKQQLASAGLELVAFHANGTGGRAMEEFAERSLFRAILDFTTTELGGDVVGGLMGAGPARMETAGRLALPQVLVPGCLDLITAGTYQEAAQDWPGRALYRHNPTLTLVRLNGTEMARLGQRFAEKANRAKGPTRIFIPTLGFSAHDRPGGAFWDPEADQAFVGALLATISESIEVECVEAHINDVGFVEHVAAALVGLVNDPGAARPLDKEVLR